MFGGISDFSSKYKNIIQIKTDHTQHEEGLLEINLTYSMVTKYPYYPLDNLSWLMHKL